jgi:hypothetical protein
LLLFSVTLLGTTIADAALPPVGVPYLGTLPFVACAVTASPHNEDPHPWVPDLNDDQVVNVLDFALWKAFFPDPAPLNSADAKRRDFNEDDAVNALDFAVWKPFFNKNC